ncbi:hypothetical protein FHG87_005145 [Trinorchestia longiramus]|nr:hypothetical protein FHG87_005145 [Trinorchestia longiramus]
MALTGLYALGVVFLLNVATEVRCQVNALVTQVEIPYGDYMEPCMSPTDIFDVEFRQFEYNASITYKRYVVRGAAISCLGASDSPGYKQEVSGLANFQSCFDAAASKGYNTVFARGRKCYIIPSAMPKEFLTCRNTPIDGDMVIYTTSDNAQSYKLPDQEVMNTCDVEADNSGFTVTVDMDPNFCYENLFRVTYGSAHEEVITPSGVYVERPMPSCMMVNFTIQRQLGEVKVGTEACIASTITKPGNIRQLRDIFVLSITTKSGNIRQLRNIVLSITTKPGNIRQPRNLFVLSITTKPGNIRQLRNLFVLSITTKSGNIRQLRDILALFIIKKPGNIRQLRNIFALFIITKPDPPTLTTTSEYVELVLTQCDYLEYTITKTINGKTEVEEPNPVVDATIRFPKDDLGDGQLQITFLSDFNIEVPPPLYYPE